MDDGNSNFITGTAKEIKAELARVPDDKIVRLIIGQPSLTVLARKLQQEAKSKGMTEEIYNDLMATLKNDR